MINSAEASDIDIDELVAENKKLKEQMKTLISNTRDTKVSSVASVWEMSMDMANMEKDLIAHRQLSRDLGKVIEKVSAEMEMLAWESRLIDRFSLCTVPGLKTEINGVTLESSGTTWGRVDMEMSNR